MRRTLAILSSGALVASLLTLGSAFGAGPAAQTPASAAPAPTVTSYAKLVNSAAVAAAQQKAGQIRTATWNWGSSFKASSTRTWWVSFTSGVRGAEMKSGQSWTKTNHYRNAVIVKLKKDGLQYTGGSDSSYEHIRSYANSRFACSVYYTTKAKHASPTARFSCVKKAALITAVKRLSPLVQAYADAGHAKKGRAFSGGTVKPSRDAGFVGYQRASAATGSAIPSGGSRAYFAKDSSSGWQFLFGSQESPSDCEAFEDTSLGSIAWVGQPCYRIVGGAAVDSTVEAWIV